MTLQITDEMVEAAWLNIPLNCLRSEEKAVIRRGIEAAMAVAPKDADYQPTMAEIHAAKAAFKEAELNEPCVDYAWNDDGGEEYCVEWDEEPTWRAALIAAHHARNPPVPSILEQGVGYSISPDDEYGAKKNPRTP